MIRVAHLIHTMLYGGVETAVLNWLEAFDRSRFEVHLFCFANPGATEQPFVEAAEARGFQVERIPWNRWKPVFRAARELARHIRAKRIDILHCHNTYAQLVTVVAGRMTGVKTITTFYVWGEFGWKRRVLQWADRYTAPLLDEISAHCQETLEETIRRGIPRSRLKLLTCGYPLKQASFAPEDRERRRRELGAGPGDVVLINLARFWPEKAHDLLLEAFRRVVVRRPNARLWLAGTGVLEPRMRELAVQLGVDGTVKFLGFRKDVPELLALADIEVHPSDMEGVALAVCEGMVAGLPVVATAVGGLVEVLRDNVSGLLVPRREPEALADAVVRLIDEPALRQRLGAAARRFIKEEYSIEAAARRVEAVYDQMLAR
jgi:glycosyltransferase involved in cell wall biosynthesis